MLWIEIENLSFFLRSPWQKIIIVKLFKIQVFLVIIRFIRFEKVVQFWTDIANLFFILSIQNVRKNCGYENLIVFSRNF